MNRSLLDDDAENERSWKIPRRFISIRASSSEEQPSQAFLAFLSFTIIIIIPFVRVPPPPPPADLVNYLINVVASVGRAYQGIYSREVLCAQKKNVSFTNHIPFYLVLPACLSHVPSVSLPLPPSISLALPLVYLYSALHDRMMLLLLLPSTKNNNMINNTGAQSP